MFSGSFTLSKEGSLMSSKGMTHLYKYIDVIERKVILEMRRAFPEGEKFQ